MTTSAAISSTPKMVRCKDGALSDAVHSRISYSNATPSGSFSSNHFSAAFAFANTLMSSLSPIWLLVLSRRHWSLFSLCLPQ